MSPVPQQYNPFREPAWRNRRAMDLVNHRPRPKRAHRTLDDRDIKTYRSFLLALKNHGESARPKLIADFPALYFAHEIAHAPDSDWSALLEARLLAREPDSLIAERLHTYPETISWYERLFFNVRDRLDSRDYIFKCCLNSRNMSRTGETAAPVGPDMAIGANCQRAAWRFYGYLGGPLVLDMLLTGLKQGPIPITGEEVADWVSDAIAETVKSKTLVATRFFQINKYNVIELINTTQQLIKTQQDAKLERGDGVGSSYNENVKAFFQQKILTAGTEAEAGRPPLLQQFDHSAAEPRASEWLDLAAGKTPQALIEKLEFRRPEPEATLLRPASKETSTPKAGN